MKINPQGPNATEIVKSNGDRILVSYKTPVAACIKGKVYRTETHHSNTTSRQINSWLVQRPAVTKPQTYFDKLI